MSSLRKKYFIGLVLFMLSTIVALFRDVYFVNEFYSQNIVSMDVYFTSMLILALIVNFIFTPFQEYFNQNKKILKYINIKLIANLSGIGLSTFVLIALYLIFTKISDKYLYIQLANLMMLIANFSLIYLNSMIYELKKMHLLSGTNLLFSSSILLIIYILSTFIHTNYPILIISICNLIIQCSIWFFLLATLLRSGLRFSNRLYGQNVLSFFSKKIFLLISFNALIFCPFYIFPFIDFFKSEGYVTAFSLGIKPFLIFQLFITFLINGIFFNDLFNKGIVGYTKIFNINFNKIFNGVILITLIILGMSFFVIPIILEFLNVPNFSKIIIFEVYFLSIILLPIIFMNVLFLKLLTLNFFNKYLYHLLFCIVFFLLPLFLDLFQIKSSTDYLSYIFVINIFLLFLLLTYAYIHKIFSLYILMVITISIFLFLSAILTFLYELYFGTILFLMLYLSLLFIANYLKEDLKLII